MYIKIEIVVECPTFLGSKSQILGESTLGMDAIVKMHTNIKTAYTESI